MRFRAIVTVQIAPGSGKPPKGSSKAKTTTTKAPVVITGNGATKLALASTTRAAALTGARLDPGTRGIGFNAKLLSDDHLMTLTITARDKRTANVVSTSWGRAFKDARTAAATQQIMGQRRAIARQLVLVDNELKLSLIHI